MENNEKWRKQEQMETIKKWKTLRNDKNKWTNWNRTNGTIKKKCKKGNWKQNKIWTQWENKQKW